MRPNAVEQLEPGQVDEHHDEDAQPPGGQEDTDGPQVEPVLRREGAAE
jgi:hypothetical protein